MPLWLSKQYCCGVLLRQKCMCECDRMLYASLRYSASPARHRYPAVTRHLAPSQSSSPPPSPRMAASPTSALDRVRCWTPGATRGCHGITARCTERDLPLCDAAPVATGRPGWTNASHPRRLASEVVIPPVYGHRQPYAEGRNTPENAQRRGGDPLRRCLRFSVVARVTVRSQPRESRE